MSLSPLEFLKHILDELNYLLEKSSESSETEFSNDATLQRAFTRSLEIIGEATKKLDREFLDRYPDIPWADMAKLRDKLIHHYFGIDYELVWNIVIVEVPKLKDQIQGVINREQT